ncbi:MAG: N-acetyltransferase [Desulforhopalus sp.]
MKIRRLTPEEYPKALALLKQAFPNSTYEVRLFENLHKNERPLHEWICIHRNKATAYIAYSNAYLGEEVCGLHLAPLAVAPQMQNQGIGSELLSFSLRQKEIRESPIFVLGDPYFYRKFGFKPSAKILCPFDKKNEHFLSIHQDRQESFTIGYEPEFFTGG